MVAIFLRLQNRQFSTDRDETLTKHDFRPRFIPAINFKALAQFPYTKLACTKGLIPEKKVKNRQFLKCSRIDNFQPIEMKP